MIVYCTPEWLDRLCIKAGLGVEQCREAIVGKDGDRLMVDADHHNYPKVAPQQPAQGGPGSELKALLGRWLGIQAKPTCPCNARAAQMDAWGPEECEKRIEEILDWLASEAQERRLPFVRIAARQMVLMAIRQARQKTAAEHNAQT